MQITITIKLIIVLKMSNPNPKQTGLYVQETKIANVYYHSTLP